MNSTEYLFDVIFVKDKIVTVRDCSYIILSLFITCPLVSNVCADSLFERSFMYGSPTLWNCLYLE